VYDHAGYVYLVYNSLILLCVCWWWLLQDFTYLTVDMFDDLSQSLVTHYPQCEQFIEQARSAEGTVLIHW